MPLSQINKKTASGLTWLILVGLAAMLLFLFYTVQQAYQGRVNLTNSQRSDCERSKLDRKDNAAFETAQRNYIEQVTDAESVKEDVKRAARVALAVFDKTSHDLRERAKIDCVKAFPKASLF